MSGGQVRYRVNARTLGNKGDIKLMPVLWGAKVNAHSVNGTKQMLWDTYSLAGCPKY